MKRSNLWASAAALAGLTLAGTLGTAFADGAADNIPDKVRPVPPPGVQVPDADRTELEAGLTDLDKAITALHGKQFAQPYLADVEVYHKAVRYALQGNEFFAPNDIQKAKALLKVAEDRCDALENGKAPWASNPGPTALGYVSQIDGSVQPYGLYIPASYPASGNTRYRLDTWFHGRGETLSEVNFIADVQRSGGPFVRPDTFVIQLYGRYCCANKLAGETDLLEALADVKRRYRIDDNKIVVRGFSMGGAACWQMAAHYASDWAAAAPGAGFSETAQFLKVFQNETVKPTWWEQKLWQMYDCPEYTPNFFNLPLVAYSGEKDSQKQAADVMEKALAGEGISMTHIIGPNTMHAYEPKAKIEVDRRIDSILETGRNPIPRKVRLATPTLKFNRQYWVTVDGLGHHWEPARVDAILKDDHTVEAATKNVTAVSFRMDPGYCPLDVHEIPEVILDGQKLKSAPVGSDRSWVAQFHRNGNKWATGPAEAAGLVKRHDLQGPIDDAFMESFMIVRPTGSPMAPGVSKWVDAELQHAITEWRRQFRGDARIKNDGDITDADIANHNLALWGDPGSNKILARIADKLPIKWTAENVTVGGKSYPSSTHAPVLIYPNPLNPNRYVVINSGFTYREYDYLNNARQVPKLPDWAIVDTTTPPNSRYTGKIVDANFFGEKWELVEGHEK